MTILFEVAATSVIHVLVPATIFLGLGVLLLLLGVHSYREGRLVANTPETPIGSIPVGLVRIHGKATGAEILTSPITGVPCYYYHVEVDKWVKKDDQERWQNFKKETAQRNFLLDDGTARVLIDPQDAEFDLPQSLRAEIGPESSHSCYVDSSVGVPNFTENQLYAYLMSDWQKTRVAVQSSEVPGAKAADKVLAVGQKMASLGFSMDVDGVSINPGETGESFRFSETCLLADREYRQADRKQTAMASCCNDPGGCPDDHRGDCCQLDQSRGLTERPACLHERIGGGRERNRIGPSDRQRKRISNGRTENCDPRRPDAASQNLLDNARAGLWSSPPGFSSLANAPSRTTSTVDCF